MPESSAETGYSFVEAGRLLGVTSDAISKRVRAGTLRVVGDRRVDPVQVEHLRQALLAGITAVDARSSSPLAELREQNRELKARVAALSEALDDARRDERRTRRERDEAVIKVTGYLVALRSVVEAHAELEEHRVKP